MPAIPINEIEREGFNALDDLFHQHEDNWNEQQDYDLYVLIKNEVRVNDETKIKYLLKKYRDEARDNHGR